MVDDTHAAPDLLRPRRRLLDVSSTLIDFAITTYDVDADALRARLPDGFAPELTTDGRALVSAVTFENTRFFVTFAPFLRLRCAQTNYRAYVTYRGLSGAFFFGTHLDSVFVALPRLVWRMPWARMRARRGVETGRYDWEARGGHGVERLVAHAAGGSPGTLPGFRSAEETARVLTAPLLGWFGRGDGRLATYSVWHAPLALEPYAVEEARFELWERLGLVAPGQAPHSVLVQARTDYLVRLPPRRI